MSTSSSTASKWLCTNLESLIIVSGETFHLVTKLISLAIRCELLLVVV